MSLDIKNIFNLENEKYTGNEPEKPGELDLDYALFKRYEPHPFEREMAFFTDTSICSGCKACEVACKQWNQLQAQPIAWANGYDNTRDLSWKNWRHVKFVERFGETNQANRPAPQDIDALIHEPKSGQWLFQTDQCKHCQESPCHEACPTGAIMRNEYGGIYYQTDICMGCGMCVAACPFGVPEISPETGRSMKCAECLDRLRDGLMPACKTACPTGAIDFGSREIMLAKAKARLDFLHKRGYKQARLYGADPFELYSGLNSFYLLMDNPEVYGLPVQPVTPVRNMALDYFRGFATLVICATALAACL